MTNVAPDYKRVLALLQSTPGRYYPTYEICESIGRRSQANSIQRAINKNLKEYVLSKNIISRFYDAHGKEYAWVDTPNSKPGNRDRQLLTYEEKKACDLKIADGYPDGHREQEKIRRCYD